jgi:hypothetical protein
LAARGGGGGGGARGGGAHYSGSHYSSSVRFAAPSGRVVIGPPGGRRYPGGYVGGSAWHGFLISGGLRGYYGPGAIYFGGPIGYPPYYYDWVYPWSVGIYPSSRPSDDVLALALPEGVLPPGGHVNGFLYFKNASAKGERRLDLAWELVEAQPEAQPGTPPNARAGRSLGSLHVPLEVVRR